MSKPSTVFQWDSNGTNTTPISSGHKTDGYGLSEVPTSGELNQQFKEIGNWLAWLNDRVNDSAVAYNLTALTASADVDTGNSNVRVVQVNPTGGDWNLNGFANGVSGRELEITNVGSRWFGLGSEASGTTATERVKWPSSKVADDDIARVYPGDVVRVRHDGSRWRVMSHVGCKFRRAVTLSAAQARIQDGSSVNFSTAPHDRVLLNQVIEVVYPVALPSGSLWYASSVYFNKVTNNTVTLRAGHTYYGNDTTSSGAETPTSTAANAPGPIRLDVTNTAEVSFGSTQPTTSHMLTITPLSIGAPGTQDEIRAVDLLCWMDV